MEAHTYPGLTIAELEQLHAAAHAIRQIDARLSRPSWESFGEKQVALGRVIAALDAAEEDLFRVVNFASSYLNCTQSEQALKQWRERILDIAPAAAAAVTEVERERASMDNDPTVTPAEYGRRIAEALARDQANALEHEAPAPEPAA